MAKRLLMAALTAVAISSLMTAIGDPAEVFTQIRDASPWWVALAALFSALTNVTDARTTRGSVSTPIPVASSIRLQVANYVTGIAAHSIGTVATTARFFKKRGIPTAAAVTSRAMIRAASLVGQVLLLILCLTGSGSTIDVSRAGSGAGDGGHGEVDAARRRAARRRGGRGAARSRVAEKVLTPLREAGTLLPSSCGRSTCAGRC